uniref:Uncharacterized protein n=1 Tax=Tetranychus urticae TaxID=32264 RepID=T1KB12_TETUR
MVTKASGCDKPNNMNCVYLDQMLIKQQSNQLPTNHTYFIIICIHLLRSSDDRYH